MKPSLFTLVLGALTMSQVQAAFPINVTATALLPHCVLDCGVSVLPPLNCSVGEPCYCARTGPVADALTACVMAGCKSLQDALKGLRYQAETCQWPTDRSLKDVGFGVNTSLVVLTTFFLIARFASRWPRWAGAGFGWDDWIALVSYVLILGITVSAYFLTGLGMGRDMWTIPGPDVLTWSKWFFGTQPLYIFVAYCTKLSLILLYLRVWPQDADRNRTFRFLTKTVGWLLCITALASVLAIIFACNPISNAWRYANRAGGTCFDRVAAAYAFGGINVIFDLIVILLPIPKLLTLRVSMRQKLGIISCFLVGFAVTACSIIRLTHLNGLTTARNATWDFFALGLWSLIEVHCSVICCCMPAMAGLLKRFFNCVAGKSVRSSQARIPSFDIVLPEKSKTDSQDEEEYVGVATLPPIASRGATPP